MLGLADLGRFLGPAAMVEFLVPIEQAEVVGVVGVVGVVVVVVGVPVRCWSIWGFLLGMGRRVWVGSTVVGGLSQ